MTFSSKKQEVTTFFKGKYRFIRDDASIQMIRCGDKYGV